MRVTADRAAEAHEQGVDRGVFLVLFASAFVRALGLAGALAALVALAAAATSTEGTGAGRQAALRSAGAPEVAVVALPAE